MKQDNLNSDSPRVLGATEFLRLKLSALNTKAANDQTKPQPDNPSEDLKTSSALDELEPGTASIGDIVDEMDERAFGFLMLLLALPCCLPFVYLLPQIVSLPMLAISGQLAAGRKHPWFPASISNRRFKIAHFQDVLNRSAKYIGWFEKLAKPRLLFLTDGIGVRIIGFLLLIPTASIMVPLPSTNTVPGIGVAMASLGLIERDGLLVLAGLIIGLLWVVLLVTFGFEVASLIKDTITARM